MDRYLGGLYRFDGDRIVRTSLLPRAATSRPRAFSDGSVCWDDYQVGGFCYRRGARPVRVDGGPFPLYETKDGPRYFSRAAGLFKKGPTATVRLSHTAAREILAAEAADGRLWIRTDGLDTVEDDSLGSACRSCLPPSVRAILHAFDGVQIPEMHPDAFGRIWIAAYGGNEAYPVATYEEESVVDGWGTLVTPDGFASTLKVKRRTTATFTIENMTFSTTSYTIDFVTKTDLSASITLDEEGNAESAEYTRASDPGTSTETGGEVPVRIALAQNFPNPFNPATTIPFTLEQAGPVRLAVYDLLGREVATLIDGVRPAGTYQVRWEAGDLPSGTYLYKLSAGRDSSTRLLTLLK